MRRWIITLVLITFMLSVVPTSWASNCEKTIIVQHGDTLTRIAARCGVTARDLAQFNRLPDPNLIRVGQKLSIPDQQVMNVVTINPNIDRPGVQACGVVVHTPRWLTVDELAAQIRRVPAGCSVVWVEEHFPDDPHPRLPMNEATIQLCQIPGAHGHILSQTEYLQWSGILEAMGCPMIFDE